MIKPALCISKEDFNKPMLQWQPTLIERSECESDESVLQIIPYIVLMDAETDKVFIYTRGNGGGESRLHTKRSIGIGGHVDIEPIANNLPLTLATEAAREICEETGYIVSAEEQKAITAQLQQGRYELIYLKDSSDSVDRVHLGLAFIILIDKTKLIQLEDNVITESNWITPIELLTLVHPTNPTCDLENWSRICVERLF